MEAGKSSPPQGNLELFANVSYTLFNRDIRESSVCYEMKAKNYMVDLGKVYAIRPFIF
jgi:hypothetical protein